MRLATREQSRLIDEAAQKGGLSAEILMEAAGAESAQEIENEFKSRSGIVRVLCGPGHNGADGLVVARHLSANGRKVQAFVFEGKHSRLFREQLERAKASGAEIIACAESADISKRVTSGKTSLFVDALFGTGLSRDVEGSLAKLIKTINETRTPIVSLDCPTGLDADRGIVLGQAVRARLTLTFGLAKRGFFIEEGPEYCGRLKVLSIGFPSEIVRKIAADNSAFDGKLAKRFLPSRKNSSNKSTYGRAVIFAGSPAMPGAALLTATSAARVGAGYVMLSSNADTREFIRRSPEFLVVRNDDEERLWAKIKDFAVAVGPGLGTGEATKKLIQRLIKAKCERVVLDADALTVLAKSPMKLPKTWVLTPHAGELARLLNTNSKSLERDRFGAAEMAAHRYGCIVLFKGYRTIVSDGTKSIVVLAGNSALAKAGSGDVLTGMIAGFLAQGLKPGIASTLAAYVHGRAADEWVRSKKDKASLLPSDIVGSIPSLLTRVRRGRS
ncbi:MAG TPA: NAD(P)H-hydrate dehydratase [Bdellovibrionales bacterium]|nr:NAD(P)H-hydrate dehydratase [Bdellovibrionales bacterium]